MEDCLTQHRQLCRPHAAPVEKRSYLFIYFCALDTGEAGKTPFSIGVNRIDHGFRHDPTVASGRQAWAFMGQPKKPAQPMDSPWGPDKPIAKCGNCERYRKVLALKRVTT